MSTSQQWTSRWQTVMSNNYGTPPVVVVRGQGSWVWDADGKKYLDMVAGIAVNALGHAHPAVRSAITAQMDEYGHVSNLAAHPVGIELAERLIELSGRPGRVFFCNSGAEANEAAFKVARLYGAGDMLAAQGSFHGRTMGALSMTGQPAKREPFEPLVPGVRFFDYGIGSGHGRRSCTDCGTHPGGGGGRHPTGRVPRSSSGKTRRRRVRC